MSRLVTWFTEQSYRRAWVVIVGVVLVLGYGTYTATTIDQELIPDIELPIVTLVVESSGSQPEQIANDYVAPIEAATTTIAGLDSTSSTSVDGLGVILYQFDFGTSLPAIQQSLNDAVDGLALPPTVQTSVLTFDVSSQPVFTFDLRGDVGQAGLQTVADEQIVPAMAALDGVASVQVVGGATDQVLITLDRAQLLQRGITYDQVAQALQSNNVVLPSGQLPTEGATLPLQTVSLLTSVDAIRAIPLIAGDGSLITLADIAQVEDQVGTSAGFSRTDGQPSVSVQVSKDKAANTVDVANSAAAELDRLTAALPAGVTASVYLNQADYITESVDAVVQEGIIGGILAIIVVFLFLRNWRTTVITFVSIPTSLIAAVIVLQWFDYSLNIMTLAGLTIAIGRVIDDSIVVLENVYRHMANGERPFDAIRNGAREVTLAILGATAATCAVFLPIGLVGGIIGQLFLPFAIAVVAALVASLLVAITIIPVMSRYLLSNKVPIRERVGEDTRPALTGLVRIYSPALNWSLRHRWVTLGIAGALLVGSLSLTPLLSVAFLPDSGENTITVSVDARPGQTAQSVLDQSVAVESLLGNYDVDTFQTVITGASSDLSSIGNLINGNAANSAAMTVTLDDGVDREDVADDLRAAIGSQIPDSGNITVSAAIGGFGGTGVAITILADTPEGQAALAGFTAQVLQTVSTQPDIVNASSNLSAVQPAISVAVDPAKAAAAGLTPQAISSSLSDLSSTQTITTATFETGSTAIRLLVSGADATTIDALGALEMAPGVRLDSVATLTQQDKQVTITRVDGQVAATVSADITSDDTGGVSSSVQAEVDKLDVPPGIELRSGGAAGDINEGFTNLLIAIIVAIVLVYVILALLFQSWLDPMVILFSLPLAIIGAILALVITGSPLSLSALIGVLMLVGIVVTNAVVLLEFVIMLRKERGYELRDALIEGAQTRLRPILMTAVAAMLALVPLSLGLTEGLLIASDLGRVVIGGLFTSTLLTLFVVPVAYSLADGARSRITRRRARRHEPTATPIETGSAGD